MSGLILAQRIRLQATDKIEVKVLKNSPGLASDLRLVGHKGTDLVHNDCDRGGGCKTLRSSLVGSVKVATGSNRDVFFWMFGSVSLPILGGRADHTQSQPDQESLLSVSQLCSFV